MLNTDTNQPKRLLTQRLRSTRSVLWAIDTFGERLRDADRTFLVWLRRQLVRVRGGLVNTERHLRHCQTRRARRIVRRNRASHDLRRLLVTARGSCAGAFGDQGMERAGFSRRISEDAETLLEQGVRVRDQIVDPAFDAPEPRIRGLSMDWKELGATLTPLIDRLGDALNEVEEARTGVRKALHERNEALSEFNRVFLHSARIVENALRGNGLDGPADRVRPSSRRPGLTQVPFIEEETAVLAHVAQSKTADHGSNDPSTLEYRQPSPPPALAGLRPRESLDEDGGVPGTVSSD